MNGNSNTFKWTERVITLALIIAGAFSGNFMDKTRESERINAVEKLAEKNADKLEKANLGLILYRMNVIERTMLDMKMKVDKLDDKIDESTDEIIDYLRANRRSR